MKQNLLRFIKSPFVKNVIIIASGTAGAQVISMVLSPIITRLYGPQAFGIMGSFSAIVRILGPIAALTYPIAIVLPRNDREAKEIIRLSLIITSIISLISLFILLIFNDPIVRIFNLKEIKNFLFLVPIVIGFAGLLQVSEQWLIRTKQFSINARVTVIQSLIVNLGKVGVGLFYPFAVVLVIFTAVADGIRATLMIIFSRRNHRQQANISLVGKRAKEKIPMKKIAKRYYDFPIYRAPEVLFNSISHGVPVLMLTAFFGPASAGFYSIGRTVLTLPSRLIGKAIGDVFYPRIAEAANNKENMTDLIKKATFALIGAGILPFGAIVLFGPFLFSFVFGSDWNMAGEYARWLSLWAAFSFVARPSVRSLPVLNAQRFHLIFTIVTTGLRVSGIAIGYFVFSSDLISVALFGIFSAISNMFLIIVTLNMSKNCKRLRA